MRAGILITTFGNFGEKGFYNVQEIGLAKEFDRLFDEVIIYKAVPKTMERQESPVDGCAHTKLLQIPVNNIGANGLWDCSAMDPTLDALVYFSDTQLAVPRVYRWCRKNGIGLFPYIGVVESHSTNKLKRSAIDLFFKRNLEIYRSCVCFAKTSGVAADIGSLGVKDIIVTPVGIDTSLLFHAYESASIDKLKEKWGYTSKDKVLLFIGRMTEEKQPIRMVRIFERIAEQNPDYRLLMVGEGVLLDSVKEAAKDLPVKFIQRVPNKDIWELYRIADAFVNLNSQEIFGMAILEAMFYGCKVVAWEAPGPNTIINDGKNGFIVRSEAECIERILNNSLNASDIHDRVTNGFSWKSTAEIMARAIQDASAMDPAHSTSNQKS